MTDSAVLETKRQSPEYSFEIAVSYRHNSTDVITPAAWYTAVVGLSVLPARSIH
jgi:hypothetical protein